MIADSLDVTMPGQQIRLVRAFRRAFAQGRPDTTKFKISPPDTTDWLRGDTIVAHFDTSARSPRDTSKAPNIQQLVALGHASSLYHLAPSDTDEHRASLNYVTARDITIDFNDSNKVATVTTVDSVAGIFIEAKADTTTRQKGASATPSKAGRRRQRRRRIRRPRPQRSRRPRHYSMSRRSTGQLETSRDRSASNPPADPTRRRPSVPSSSSSREATARPRSPCTR